ncbi:tubby-like protein 8 [Tanacetum coccineum]|uniref:Tubby-like protein 8 n=1 Tax=Tanacetum coccineum TaxID=301880 RepID=A0ABQ5HQ60_9ASTR
MDRKLQKHEAWLLKHGSMQLQNTAQAQHINGLPKDWEEKMDKPHQHAKTAMVVAPIASLVSAQCIIIWLWTNNSGFIALRGAVTLKARALNEVWNVAAVIPIDIGVEINKKMQRAVVTARILARKKTFLKFVIRNLWLEIRSSVHILAKLCAVVRGIYNFDYAQDSNPKQLIRGGNCLLGKAVNHGTRGQPEASGGSVSKYPQARTTTKVDTTSVPDGVQSNVVAKK